MAQKNRIKIQWTISYDGKTVASGEAVNEISAFINTLQWIENSNIDEGGPYPKKEAYIKLEPFVEPADIPAFVDECKKYGRRIEIRGSKVLFPDGLKDPFENTEED